MPGSARSGGPAHAARARPALYWIDLLATTGLGWALFLASTWLDPGGPAHLAATAGASLALLRAFVFLHEIAHRRGGRRFELAWNALVGIPLCVPSFMYVGSHTDHHRVDRFATWRDPEYAPIAGWGLARRLAFVVGGALIPVLLVMRWGVLAPLCLVWPRARPLVRRRFSTLAINPSYTREPVPRRDRWRWRILEPAAAAFVWSVAGAAIAGEIRLRSVVQWALVLGGIAVVNQLRTLAAHGYTNFGRRVDLDGQLRDSINLSSGPWAALVAPLGLRFHALHHLHPELPYHDLGRVHRELVARRPAEPRYRHAGSGTLARALAAAPPGRDHAPA